WYGKYVASGWFITAFKIAGDGARADTSAVRMSFRTEAPFFPYREPEGAPAGGRRKFVVYFLGDTRVEGKIERSGRWMAGTAVSRDLPPDAAGALAGFLKTSLPAQS